MKRIILFATGLTFIVGCSKNNGVASSENAKPFFQYTAQWSSGSAASQSGSSVNVDTFSTVIQLSGNLNIFREINADENNKVDYYFIGSDTTATLINTLQFYLKSLNIQVYHIDSASLAAQSGDFEYVATYADLIGKDIYNL